MPASIPRLVDPLYRLRSALKRYTTLKASGCNLVTHFSYHKCLTSYYQSVVRALSTEFDFYYEHFTSDYPRFEQAALNDPRRRVLIRVATSGRASLFRALRRDTAVQAAVRGIVPGVSRHAGPGTGHDRGIDLANPSSR
jgi:hypothetical protein